MRFSSKTFAACAVLASLIVGVPASAAAPPLVSSTPRQQMPPPTEVETLERGYRTGYSDGYQSGYADSAGGAARDYRRHEDYRAGDRTYVGTYGAREVFRNGYQQGFEAAYDTGYDRRPFDSTVPTNLRVRNDNNQRDTGVPRGSGTVAAVRTEDDRAAESVSSTIGGARRKASVFIPADTILLAELETSLSSDASQPGDRVQARVLEPREYEGALLAGVVKRVRRPGKVKGTAELQISFDQVSLPDGRWAEMEAQITEVMEAGERTVGEVDEEGGIRGRSSAKSDAAKVGVGAGIGALIGAIAGGGTGAAIGATVGGAGGAGGVLASRGDELRLRRGDQLRLRTARSTEFR